MDAFPISNGGARNDAYTCAGGDQLHYRIETRLLHPDIHTLSLMTSTEYEHWLGRSETVAEVLSLTVIERICAALNHLWISANHHLPHLWLWCFFQSTLPASELRRDEHPALGGFLPPAEGRNRMWAGGRLKFFQPLLADQSAERRNATIQRQPICSDTQPLPTTGIASTTTSTTRLK